MAYPEDIRPILVEVLINGTWMDISQYVLQRQSSTLTRGAGGEDNSMPPTTLTLLLNNEDGRFSQDNPMSPYWPYFKQSVQIRYSIVHSAVTYVRFWGETADAPMVVDDAEDNTVTLDCAGWFRRWERSKRLESPLRRTMRPQPQLVAYWPFEDEGEDAQALAAVTPNTRDAVIKAPISVAANGDTDCSYPIPDIGDGQVDCTPPAFVGADDQFLITFVLAGSGVAADQTTICSIKLYGGTVSRISVLGYTNGQVAARVYDRDGSIISTGSQVAGSDIRDNPSLMMISVTQNGADVAVAIDQKMQTGGSAGATAVFTSQNMGRPSGIVFGYFNNLGMAVGHVGLFRLASAFLALADFSDLILAVRAYRSETASTRFRRLCRENGVANRVIGNGDTRMGPQRIGTLKEMLSDCADTDHSVIFESRDEFGLTMIGRAAFYNQGVDQRLDPAASVAAASTSFSSLSVSYLSHPRLWPGVRFQVRVSATDALVEATVFTVTAKRLVNTTSAVIDFSPAIGTLPATTHIVTPLRSGVLALNYADIDKPFRPEKDNRLAANRVTVARSEGSSATASLDVGPRSTKEQPEGIGLYDESKTLNLYSDGDPPQHASWLLGQGTHEDARFSNLDVALHRRSVVSKQAALLTADIGHLVTVDGASPAFMFDQIRQLLRGYTETFDGNRLHTISANTVPARPFEILTFDDPNHRWGAASTVLAGSLTSSQTGSVDVAVGQDVWTTSGSDFPMPIVVGGELVTISDINGGAGSITFIGTGTSSAADNGSVTPGLPAGAANGHTVLILASIRKDTATINVPANWTLIHSAGSNMKLFARTYNGVWTMPTVTVSGGAAGDTVIGQSCAFNGITPAATLTNLPLSGTGDDIKVNTDKMDSVHGQYGLRIVCGIRFDDWTSVIAPSGTDEIEEIDSTLGNDLGQVWAYAIDTDAANFSKSSGTFTVTGGTAAFFESFVAFLASAPQEFVISARSVNGVVKAHTPGTSIDVADPKYYGL